jgi:hypothetical protein
MAHGLEAALYEHYKGGRYSVLGLVTHHDTRMPMVKYVSHTYGGENVRPVVGWPGDSDGWCDMVSTAGGKVPRFRYLGPLPSDIPLKER